MAITYTWTIPTLERHTSDGGLTYDASASDFTPYANITLDQAKGWVWGHVSQEDTEAAIATKIDAIANPTSASGTPWAA
jgi:hypothetical protein